MLNEYSQNIGLALGFLRQACAHCQQHEQPNDDIALELALRNEQHELKCCAQEFNHRVCKCKSMRIQHVHVRKEYIDVHAATCECDATGQNSVLLRLHAVSIFQISSSYAPTWCYTKAHFSSPACQTKALHQGIHRMSRNLECVSSHVRCV